MALFGKNKGDTSSSGAASDNSNVDAFDFDSIARDLHAHNGGASAFDNLLAQPVSGDSAHDDVTISESAPAIPSTNDGSAFDFPAEDDELDADAADEADELGFSQTPAPRSIHSNVTQVNSENDPFGLLADGTPVLGASDEVPRPLAPRDDEMPASSAKNLPLVPLAGGLLSLLLLGAGAYSLLKDQNSPATPATPIVQVRATPAPDQSMANSPAMPATAAPRAADKNPVVAKNPVVMATQARPLVKTRALEGANSGIAARPAAAQAPLTPAIKASLKTLWNTGAAAKKRGDYAAARLAWQQALKVRPNHPGFQESIDKLPR